MKDLLQHLIEALREELKEYGEMLALLEQQQQLVIHSKTQDLLQCVASINSQAETIAGARREREQHRRHVAMQFKLDENASFQVIIPLIAPEYRPLVKALVHENNELLVRVHQCARQNHLLLNRVTDFMQKFIGSLLPGNAPTTYNDSGRMMAAAPLQFSIYDAIG